MNLEEGELGFTCAGIGLLTSRRAFSPVGVRAGQA